MSHDHYGDRILDKNMDREKMSHDHYRDRILDRDIDREKTRHDHSRDKILDRDMDNEKDESRSGTGSSTGTWTGKRTRHA